MNVLQLLPELNVGGVETGTIDFAKYLIEQGHRSIIVSNGGILVKRLVADGSRHIELPVHKKSIWTMIKSVRELNKLIIKEKIDIVHARSRVPAWIGYFACKKTRASFITTCHGHYGNRIFSKVMGWAKLVITPSDVIARHMIEDYGVPSEDVRVIPRSVDLDRFRIDLPTQSKSTKDVVCMVGRISPIKGHTYFLKAMAQVIRNYPLAEIWIIGDAPKNKQTYKEELEILVKRLGIKSNVKFLGNRQDVPQLLAQASVCVMSSITKESFGRVILEAQAVGVPVVATKVGGVVEIIEDRITGLLVLPKDIDAMAKEVLGLLKDKSFGQKLTEQAQKKIREKYTIEQMSSKTVEVYEELLSKTKILVIKLGAIGDVVLVTASLKAIRNHFPESKIYCVVGEESRKILLNCPYLDGIFVYEYKYKDKSWFSLWKLSKVIRRHHFDKIIDFQNNRRSHLLSFLCYAKESYGYNNGKWGKLLSNPLSKYAIDMPAVDHQFQLLKQLKIPSKGNHYLELWPSNKDRQYIKSLLDAEWLGNAKNIVGINIAASARWESKNWPIAHIAKLCDLLAAKNVRVVITGIEKDKKHFTKLSRLTRSKPTNLIGKTDMLQLAVLIKKCKAFVTSDSAPLHVAAAVQTPIIALFGPTDSARHVPPAKKLIVLEKKPSCAPCYSGKCQVLTHVCMKEITPEEVAQEIFQFIKVTV